MYVKESDSSFENSMGMAFCLPFMFARRALIERGYRVCVHGIIYKKSKATDSSLESPRYGVDLYCAHLCAWRNSRQKANDI